MVVSSAGHRGMNLLFAVAHHVTHARAVFGCTCLVKRLSRLNQCTYFIIASDAAQARVGAISRIALDRVATRLILMNWQLIRRSWWATSAMLIRVSAWCHSTRGTAWQALAQEYGIKFFATSAKSNANVDDVRCLGPFIIAIA